MSDNFEKHKATINGLYRQAREDLWTSNFATLVLLLGAIPVVTIFFNVAVFSFGHWVIGLIVYFIEILAPLAVLALHQRKIYERVREKALEMNAAQPGIYEAYEEWHKKIAPPQS